MSARGDGAVRFDALQRVDAQLSCAGPVLSLGPGRPRARTLTDLAAALVRDAEVTLARALVDGLAAIVGAMRAAFPDNLFWDLDYLAASLLRHARGSAAPAVALQRLAVAIADLQRQFGHRSAIAFRYVHDFSYGFDWAKWVAKDPPARSEVGPFDPDFVAHMQRRGAEIMQRVEQGDDDKYPPVATGAHRNPFGFSRQPRAEVALLRRLARQGLVPVEAWRIDATPRWDRDFAGLRRDQAVKLGLRRDD